MTTRKQTVASRGSGQFGNGLRSVERKCAFIDSGVGSECELGPQAIENTPPSKELGSFRQILSIARLRAIRFPNWVRFVAFSIHIPARQELGSLRQNAVPAPLARPRDNGRMRRLVLLLLVPAILPADTWVKFTSGPFEVFTDAGARPGREAMVRFLEFRHAVGLLLGEPELGTPLPVRVLVLKNPRGWTPDKPISEGRDRYNIVLPEKSSGSPALYVELTRLFLQANTKQMPPAFERGLISFFSTAEINGIAITVGAPPPQPDVDWARIHLLVVSPEYFGKLRVLLSNLRRGVDEEPAYRNAFGKSASRGRRAGEAAPRCGEIRHDVTEQPPFG